MTVEKKAKIYNFITIFCVILCMLLIGRVACDELFGGERPASHVPPAITEKTAQSQAPIDGIKIDCRMIEEQLAGYLPDGFPLEDIRVEIGADGALAIDAKASKSKIRDYLETAGVELGGGFLFKLLPGKADIRVEGVCSCDEESRMLALAVGSLKVGDLELDISKAAEGCFSELSKGLNKLMLASGVSFNNIEFGDGYILLK